MSELLAVRHGQASLFAADYDVLSELGHEQGRALGRSWAGRGFAPTEFISGPARRQRGTAVNVCEQLSVDESVVEVRSGFDEHDAFSMMKAALPQLVKTDEAIAKLQQRFQDETDRARRSAAFQLVFEAVMERWLAGEVPEAAQSWSAFRDAVDEALAQTLAAREGPGRRVAVFTSVGPIAVLLMRALGTSPHDAFRTAFRVRNASVTRFLFRGTGRLTLDQFNDTSHLPPGALTHR